MDELTIKGQHAKAAAQRLAAASSAEKHAGLAAIGVELDRDQERILSENEADLAAARAAGAAEHPQIHRKKAVQ